MHLTSGHSNLAKDALTMHGKFELPSSTTLLGSSESQLQAGTQSVQVCLHSETT